MPLLLFVVTTHSYRVSGTPKLHKEFRNAVNQLPKTYSPENKHQFYKLIDNFGTHYITKVRQHDGETESNAIFPKNGAKYDICLSMSIFEHIIPGEVGRKCYVCDQHQAVPGKAAGLRSRRGADVSGS